MPPRLITQLVTALQLTLFTASSVLAQSSNDDALQRAEIARQIRQTVDELHSLRQEHRRSDDEHRSQIGRVQRQIELLQQELDPVETAAKTEQQTIIRLESQIQNQEKLAANAKAWINQAADNLKPLAVNVTRRVGAGVSEQKLRRLAEFSKAVELLGSEEPLARVDGIAEFLRVLGDEWLPSRSVTLSSDTVLVYSEQRQEHAWVVGVGLVAKVFVSEDGKLTGISLGGTGTDWELDLSEDVQQQVRDLIGVVREQRPPTVTSLPVMTSGK